MARQEIKRIIVPKRIVGKEEFRNAMLVHGVNESFEQMLKRSHFVVRTGKNPRLIIFSPLMVFEAKLRARKPGEYLVTGIKGASIHVGIQDRLFSVEEAKKHLSGKYAEYLSDAEDHFRIVERFTQARGSLAGISEVARRITSPRKYNASNALLKACQIYCASKPDLSLLEKSEVSKVRVE